MLSWRYDVEMGTVNSLHVSAEYGKYYERSGFWFGFDQNNHLIFLLIKVQIIAGQTGINYANWLLKERDSNNHWMTLVTSLAAMEGLQNFVQYSRTFYDDEDGLNVNVRT